MKFKKAISVGLAAAMTVSMFSAALFSSSAETIENPNPQAAEIDQIQAIRNQLTLVWNDEFGGDIGCGMAFVETDIPAALAFDKNSCYDI